jgi:hypothetical protein
VSAPMRDPDGDILDQLTQSAEVEITRHAMIVAELSRRPCNLLVPTARRDPPGWQYVARLRVAAADTSYPSVSEATSR